MQDKKTKIQKPKGEFNVLTSGQFLSCCIFVYLSLIKCLKGNQSPKSFFVSNNMLKWQSLTESVREGGYGAAKAAKNLKL